MNPFSKRITRSIPDSSRLAHDLGEIHVQRKAIRHLYLRLDPDDGSLRVSAPRRTPDRAIHAFVTSRGDWIDRQRQKLARRPAPITENRLPERLHLLGEEHDLEWRQTAGSSPGRLTCDDFAVRIESPDLDRARVLLRDHCRQQLKALLAERVPLWGGRMSLPCPEIRVRRMRTRWGTCNIGAQRIWLALELVRLPVEAIDLVVVHELAHLIERGHNRRFYGVMDRAYPAWRQWEATLSRYGMIGL
ncbi:M48 family metallopeptidase [Guyparkeria hydrothermalis]|uniref:M48 family metallopeptidase n=1 Tax=Guyparkeria hydrothermalis TaxID=923 RepID=UPI00201FFC3F|nr:SprT family zinc-dependent metalloprotease [Guyparkeria hydrothermalis]MCL7743732.1 M48 family metallopeptidase [Guyparkeria hydrothermalis]